MLHGDKFVFHGLCLFLCLLEGGVHVDGDIEPVGVPAAGDSGDFPQFGGSGSFQTFHRHVHFPQQLRDQAPILPQQRQKQMHLLHLLVIILHRKVSRALDSLQGFLRIIVKIHKAILPFAS